MLKWLNGSEFIDRFTSDQFYTQMILDLLIMYAVTAALTEATGRDNLLFYQKLHSRDVTAKARGMSRSK